MITICRKAFFYERLRRVETAFFEVPLRNISGIRWQAGSDKIFV